MVLQFVGEYVIAFLLKTLHREMKGFLFEELLKNLMDTLRINTKTCGMINLCV